MNNHHDFQNLNKFEVAVVGMIVVGFIIFGLIVFCALTPRQQIYVADAIQIFDIHQQAAEAAQSVEFVVNIPNEFYAQFYIAFAEVVTLPSETFEVPTEVISQISSNISLAVNELAVEVATNYQKQNNFYASQAPEIQYDYTGKVAGAMIDLSDRLSTVTVLVSEPEKNLKIPYEYNGPNLNLSSLSQFY